MAEKITASAITACTSLSCLLCTDETLLAVLDPDAESSVQDGHGPVGAHPEESHKNDPRDGTLLL